MGQNVITMAVGKDNEVSSNICRFDRAGGVVVNKRVNKENNAAISCNLKR